MPPDAPLFVKQIGQTEKAHTLTHTHTNTHIHHTHITHTEIHINVLNMIIPEFLMSILDKIHSFKK